MTAPTTAVPWPRPSAALAPHRVQRTTLASQTWHLIRWDVVLLWRWWLALLGLSVLAALQSTAVTSGSTIMLSILGVGGLALVTMLMVITAVHHDRPDDPDAFWQGLPLDVRAHAMAKVSLTFTTLLPLALAAAWSLHHAGISVSQLPRHLLVPLFTSWKLNVVALTFATCTRRSGVTLVAMLGSWLVPVMLFALLMPSNFALELVQPSSLVRGIVLLTSIAGVGALVWASYALPALPVVLRLILASTAGWGLWFGNLSALAAPDPELPPVEAESASFDITNIAEVDSRLRFDLQVQGLDSTRRYDVRSASIRWQRAPGDTASLRASWSQDTTLRTIQELAVAEQLEGDIAKAEPSPVAAVALGLRNPSLADAGSLSVLRGHAPGPDSLRALGSIVEIRAVRLAAESLVVATWRDGTLYRGRGLRVDLTRDWVNRGSGWQLTTSAFRSANFDPFRVRLSDFENLLDVRPILADGQRGAALVPFGVSTGMRPVILPGLSVLTSTQQFEALALSGLDPSAPRVRLSLWKREGQLRLTSSLPNTAPVPDPGQP